MRHKNIVTASSELIPESVNNGTRCTIGADMAMQQNITANAIHAIAVFGLTKNGLPSR